MHRLFLLKIIKLIHIGETDLNWVGCLMRLPEEKQFFKSLRLEWLGDILTSPTDRKLLHDTQLRQITIHN